MWKESGSGCVCKIIRYMSSKLRILICVCHICHDEDAVIRSIVYLLRPTIPT